MVMNLKVRGHRGGNNHPIATKQFILDHLARVGEDYIAGIHQAFKEALRQLARERMRKYHYFRATYATFNKRVWELMKEGRVEFSGREEPSDDPRFKNWDEPPMRRYVRLVRR